MGKSPAPEQAPPDRLQRRRSASCVESQVRPMGSSGFPL